ncbi:MAG: transcription termination/antitermination factor NusG [Clostridiales bacterium]|nr:transcription termination/antitermination factor NusG [Clostridiales bacterium]
MNVGPRWYVAHTYSGYENKVKTNIEKVVENRNLSHLIYDVRVPVETVIEKNGDKEKEVELKVFPGYVLVKMTMTDESWHAVRNIRGVTGFVGPGSRPTPLTDAEVEALEIEEKRVQLSFGVGDNVNINAGLFEGYSGVVQEISEDNKTVTVLVKRGRRDMPVELDINQIVAAEN